MHAKKRKGGDRELAKTASAAIECLTTIPHERFRVHAHNGVLDLDGRVDSVYQRNLAEGVARALPGVRRVSNWLWVEADPAFREARAAL